MLPLLYHPLYRTVWTIWRYLLRIPRKKGPKRSNVDAFDAKEQNKVQIVSGSVDLQGTSHIGNPLVVPESCADVETSLAPLADSERDTENSEVSQDVLKMFVL